MEHTTEFEEETDQAIPKNSKLTGKRMSLLTILPPGEDFITSVKPKNVAHYAKSKGIRVVTTQVLITEYQNEEPVCYRATKVTILKNLHNSF